METNQAKTFSTPKKSGHIDDRISRFIRTDHCDAVYAIKLVHEFFPSLFCAALPDRFIVIVLVFIPNPGYSTWASGCMAKAPPAHSVRFAYGFLNSDGLPYKLVFKKRNTVCI